MTQKVVRTRTKTVQIPDTPEFRNNLESLIRESTNNNVPFKMSMYAAENKFNPAELKKYISSHFQNNIQFKRGRTGGAVWVENSLTPTNVS